MTTEESSTQFYIYVQTSDRTKFDHFSYRVQLVEVINIHEYTNERSGVSLLASNNKLPRLKDRYFIKKITCKNSP
jgi:hypothetical protein